MTSRRRSPPTPPAGSTPAEQRAESADGWVVPTTGGCLLRVHVQPGAARAGVAGLHGDALRVRVAARAVDGAANRDLLALIATVLGVRPSHVSLESGAQSRRKRLRVTGISADAARARLASIDKGGAGD